MANTTEIQKSPVLNLPNVRIAFVHDNYMQHGGAERVAEVIARILPAADLFSTVVFPEKLSPYMRTRRITDTVFRRIPGLRKYYRHFFFLYPIAARSLDLSDYDVVISSCCGFGKMVTSRKDALHICYCHTPTRWIWRFDDYAERENFSPLIRSLLKMVISLFKGLDRRASNNPDFFLANSTTVAQRIRSYYNRESLVLFPPVDCQRFTVSHCSEPSYLIVSRLLSYKRIDLAIEACERIGRRLIVVGDGPDRRRLESLCGPHTKLMGRLSDADVALHMSQCQALLFPGEEDFGLTPLEANAAGKPCIAYAKGGTLDTIIDGVTGVLFAEASAESIAEAIIRSESTKWTPELLRCHAERFDTAVFAEKFVEFVSRSVDRWSTRLELCQWRRETLDEESA
jgi:glycosyltransferase involved in cell wall biosynthesis